MSKGGENGKEKVWNAKNGKKRIGMTSGDTVNTKTFVERLSKATI